MGDALSAIGDGFDEGSEVVGGGIIDGVEEGWNVSTDWITNEGYDAFEDAINAIKNVTFDVMEWTIDLFD